LYLLLILGSGGYVWLESRRQVLGPPTELDEGEWLDEVGRRLADCGAARVYVRYFRDPDHGDDERLSGKRDKIKAIMTRFCYLLLDHEASFSLIAFRKRSWTDDPKAWLVHKMREAKPDLSEAELKATVDKRVLVIHDEPQPNASTIYLIDDRFLLFNRVTWEGGTEKKTYHAQDLSHSIMPFLIKRGFEDLFHRS